MAKKKQTRKRTPLSKKFIPQASIVSDELYIPNHSGMLDAGKVHRTPTEELDPVNKAYVDSQIRGKIDLFLTENGSDIGGYFDLETDVMVGAKEDITQTITGNSTTLIASFASILDDTAIDSITLLEAGIYSAHFHASTNFAIGMTLYFEFYHRTAVGVETLLGTSHDTSVLTTSEKGYELHATVTEDKAFVAGDRIVVKVYGRNGGAAAKNITIYMEGDTAARVEFPGFIAPGGFLLDTGDIGTGNYTFGDPTFVGPWFFVDGVEASIGAASIGVFVSAFQTGVLRIGSGSGQDIEFYPNNGPIRAAITGDGLDMKTYKIENVADPTANQEAATKKYVDDTAVPGGANEDVQFNDAGAFGGDSTFIYRKTAGRLHVETITLGVAGVSTYNTPLADGTANQIIETDGSGALSWVDNPTLAVNTILVLDGAVATLDGNVLILT